MASPPSIEHAHALVGTTLRRKWRLDALIGVGGMANVYAATHRNGRRGAVKLLNRTFSEHPEVRERFLREGYVANRIRHPGVVSILDDDEAEDGSAFLVMELLDGSSFHDRLREHGPLDPAEALFVVDQVLDVLSAAHRSRIVHRDIKPGNVFLLRDGRVKVLDFGLARVLDGMQGETLTRDGMVLGTVSYMSPEQAQARRGEIDERSDVFAVGATLFFALSGEFVHEEPNPMDRLMAAMRKPARSLSTVARRLPGSLVAAVDRALCFEKSRRYASAGEMQSVLRAAFLELTGRPIPVTQRLSLHGIQGWARPSRPEPSGSPGPAAQSTALAISVVFEPDPHVEAPAVPLMLSDSDIQSSLAISVTVEPIGEATLRELPLFGEDDAVRR